MSSSNDEWTLSLEKEFAIFISAHLLNRGQLLTKRTYSSRHKIFPFCANFESEMLSGENIERHKDFFLFLANIYILYLASVQEGNRAQLFKASLA